MAKPIWHCAFRGAALLVGLPLLAQQYPFIPVPGAPTNIDFLFEDSRGRMWVSGDQSAVYDGTRFFPVAEYGLPAVKVCTVHEDHAGAMWVSTVAGVFRLGSGRAEKVFEGNCADLLSVTPNMLIGVEDGPSEYRVRPDKMLIRIRHTGGHWTRETIQQLESHGAPVIDHGGMVLYPGPPHGWNEFPLDDAINWEHGKGDIRVIHHEFPPEVPSDPARFIQRDRFGCLWASLGSGYFYSCQNDRWDSAPTPASALRGFAEAPDGSMLLRGVNMLGFGRPGSFHIAKVDNGLPAQVTAMQASDGTIWVGGAQGLYRFPWPFRIEYWTPQDGVDSPWSIQRSGAEIFAGLDRTFGKLTPDRRRWVKLTSFSSTGAVLNLLPFGNDLLAAINPAPAVALLRRDGKILAASHIPMAESGGERLARTDQGEIWIGGRRLWQLTRDSSGLVLKSHKLETQPSRNVLAVQYEPNTRTLWACYNGGLVSRDQLGNWREITMKDGLLINPCWSLAALPNGDVWYGYDNLRAFARVRPLQRGNYDIRQFRESEELPDAQALNFNVDRRGWLWRGGMHGLSVSDPTDAEQGRWVFLDQSDGLSSEGINTGSYFEDRDGSIWTGIDNTIFHVAPPAELLTPRFSPKVFLSSFSIDSASPKPAGTVPELPRGNLVAHLGTLQFDRRHALKFRYRLLSDSTWHETRSLDIPLGKLGGGEHTLEVQARVFTGPWSETVRDSFRVLRPFWLTAPFLLACAAGFTLTGSGAYLLHRRRKEEEAPLLPDLARWRASALLADVHDLSGSVLGGRFEVRDHLARGGFANVMDGFDLAQHQRCAIKVFRNEVKDKARIVKNFQQEVAALTKIHHGNVVSIYAHGVTEAGSPYLVMEFVEGRSLREILETGALSPARTARALRQLASALDAIHALGICHRDVKPENIVIRNEGLPSESPVLIDFSIAIVKDADETLYGLSRAAGTFDYMGPEQAIGYAQASSDIYSLAKLLLEMLTGSRLKALLPDAALDLPDRVRGLAMRLPVTLSIESINMLGSALEFDPSRRPGNAGEFAAPLVRDLEAFSPLKKSSGVS